ncbi:MAG: hypothetical protein ACI88A_002423 [Paraglaciecola sp.]|jgi:hypothetical protein
MHSSEIQCRSRFSARFAKLSDKYPLFLVFVSANRNLALEAKLRFLHGVGGGLPGYIGFR